MYGKKPNACRSLPLGACEQTDRQHHFQASLLEAHGPAGHDRGGPPPNILSTFAGRIARRGSSPRVTSWLAASRSQPPPDLRDSPRGGRVARPRPASHRSGTPPAGKRCARRRRRSSRPAPASGPARSRLLELFKFEPPPGTADIDLGAPRYRVRRQPAHPPSREIVNRACARRTIEPRTAGPSTTVGRKQSQGSSVPCRRSAPRSRFVRRSKDENTGQESGGRHDLDLGVLASSSESNVPLPSAARAAVRTGRST